MDLADISKDSAQCSPDCERVGTPGAIWPFRPAGMWKEGCKFMTSDSS